MKTSAFFFLITITVLNVTAQVKELTVKSNIKAVTVFFQNAQISRSGNISLPSGESKLVLKGLSPFIDSNSIQAKIDGEVAIISVVHQKDYLGEIKASELQLAIDKIGKDKSYLNVQLAVNKEKEAFLKENKSIGGSNTGYQLSDLREISAFYAAQLKSLKTESLEIKIKIELLNKEIRALRKQLQETQGGSFSSSGKVIVLVKSKASFQGKVSISYLVRNAGWLPAYDVRVKNINSPLEISFKAKLKQNTGENWKNIKLTFSNADPTQNSTLPVLNPYYLRFNPVYRKSMNRMNMAVYDNEEEAPMMLEGKAAGIQVKRKVSFKDNIPQTTRIENQTNLEYTLNKPYSLKSGNESSSLTLIGFEAPASFEYQVIPKRQEKAYLVAQIANWSQYDLIEAPTSLFFENTFIGKTLLNTSVVSDTLDVSLGQDKNVLIKREKLKDFQKKRYIGSNITESRAWKITLRNQKSQAIKITVKDQVPVSTNSDIQVDVTELSGGKQNKTTGEVTWKLTLQPNEQRELVIKYNVKYPKSKRLVVE